MKAALQWAMLAGALALLNASLTFENALANALDPAHLGTVYRGGALRAGHRRGRPLVQSAVAGGAADSRCDLGRPGDRTLRGCDRALALRSRHQSVLGCAQSAERGCDAIVCREAVAGCGSDCGRRTGTADHLLAAAVGARLRDECVERPAHPVRADGRSGRSPRRGRRPGSWRNGTSWPARRETGDRRLRAAGGHVRV